MALSPTQNTPSGQIQTASDVFLEGGPEFWFGGVPKYSPDADGFFWGVTGTAQKPLFKIGCYTDFRLRDNLQITDVRCDVVGVVGTIQKRNYLEISFTLLSLLPLSALTNIIHGGTVLTNGAELTEEVGLGIIDNNIYFMFWFSRVYDTVNGNFVAFTGHRCQFVDVWEMGMHYGAPWTLGVRARLFADQTKPDPQKFASVLRFDPVRIPGG